MITTSLSLPVGLSVLLAGFQLQGPPTSWGTWGKTDFQGKGDRRTAVELSSLLTSLDIDPKSNRLMFDSDHPLTVVYCPTQFNLTAVLMKAGTNKVLYSQPFRIEANPQTDPFYRIHPQFNPRGPKPYQFDEAEGKGEYILGFMAAGVAITQIPFSVDFEKSPDLPKQSAFVTGPWENWAYLWFSTTLRDQGPVEVRLWRRASSETGGMGDEYQVYVLDPDDRLLAESEPQSITSFQQTRLRFPLNDPKNSSGGLFRAARLLARVGEHHVLVEKNGKLDAVYPFTVKGGQLLTNNEFVFHPFQPHPDRLPTTISDKDYIVPRMPSDQMTINGAGDTIWMERLSKARAEPYGQILLREPPSLSADQLKRWQVRPTSSPDRPFELVRTGIRLPDDALLSVGDDLIAIGSKSFDGVKYLKVGSGVLQNAIDQARVSPEIFYATGKKLVLVKDHQVLVHDVTTGVTDVIPPDQVFLADSESGSSPAKVLSGDGYLVGTVNQKNRVADGLVIKVIDISQSPPQIIPIKNADYEAAEVSAIAVDAETGQLAVSSRLKERLYLAKALPSADQIPVDLSNALGVADRPIQLGEGFVLYADAKNQLHQLDAAKRTTRIIETGLLGAANQGVAVAQGRIAVATNHKYGSRYPYWIGTFPGQPKPAPNLGEPIADQPGCGMGGSVAIAADQTVFLAGSGQFGAGEFLQYHQGEDWKVVRNAQGLPLPATDVVAGSALIAFKTPDQNGEPELAYAVYGSQVAIPTNPQPQVASNAGNSNPTDSQSSPSVSLLRSQVKVSHRGDPNGEPASEVSARDNPQSSPKSGTHLWLITFVLIAHLGIGAAFSLLILR